jgi:hypothetical protein
MTTTADATADAEYLVRAITLPYVCCKFMLRFLLALVDPSPAVRQLAEYLLKDVMAVKAPLLAYNHFVEALFVLNGCTAGLHGSRLGENLGHAGQASSMLGLVAAGSTVLQDETVSSPGQGQLQDKDDGASGAAVLSAPAQFVLQGRHNRCCSPCIPERHTSTSDCLTVTVALFCIIELPAGASIVGLY